MRITTQLIQPHTKLVREAPQPRYTALIVRPRGAALASFEPDLFCHFGTPFSGSTTYYLGYAVNTNKSIYGLKILIQPINLADIATHQKEEWFE
jgi:hypothetical protein